MSGGNCGLYENLYKVANERALKLDQEKSQLVSENNKLIQTLINNGIAPKSKIDSDTLLNRISDMDGKIKITDLSGNLVEKHTYDIQMELIKSNESILEERRLKVLELQKQKSKLEDDILLKTRQTKYMMDDTDEYSSYIKILKYMLVILFILGILIYIYRIRKFN